MAKPTSRLGRLAPVLLALLPCACNGHQDAERLANVGRRVVGRFDRAAGGQFAERTLAIRGGLTPLGLDARVTYRLRWDKALEGVPIRVRAKGDVVELEGVVPTLAAKRRAVDLAESTEGVASVVADGLEVNER